jgi:two-component system KDP operon response regulator KdpE
MARILVADADPAVRRSLGRYLRKLGHDVVDAGEAGGALQALTRGGVSLVMAEVDSPEVERDELFASLRHADSAARVIAIGGEGPPPDGVIATLGIGSG